MSMPRRAKICQSILEVLADLEDAGSSSTRLQRLERVLFRDLVRRKAWPPARTGRCRPACRRRDGRSARSRLRCRPTASEKPHRARRHRIERRCVSVSIATTPMSLARSTQAFSRSSVRTVSYLPRSILLGLRRGKMRGRERRGRASPRLSALLRGCGGGANRSPLLAVGGRMRRPASPAMLRPAPALPDVELGVGLDLARPRCRTSPRRAASAW